MQWQLGGWNMKTAVVVVADTNGRIKEDRSDDLGLLTFLLSALDLTRIFVGKRSELSRLGINGDNLLAEGKDRGHRQREPSTALDIGFERELAGGNRDNPRGIRADNALLRVARELIRLRLESAGDAKLNLAPRFLVRARSECGRALDPDCVRRRG
jgi:hypothetical protein